jgi:hypothetical protein
MFNGKAVRVMLKGDALESFLLLKKRNDKEARSIIRSIERVTFILKDNPLYGQAITRRLFPRELLLMGIQNLYRAELSNYWRMLYTIEGNEIEIYLIVLRIVNHKEYNKVFGYR